MTPAGSGTAVTYTGGFQRVPGRHGVRSGDMRSHPTIAAFVRLCGVIGLGAYLGGAAAGLIAVLAGQAFRDGWPAAIPASAVVGLGVGAAVGWLTRRWLLARVPGRWWVFTLAGLVTLPLFSAVSQLHAVESVGVPLIMLGGVAMVVVYHRASRVTPSSSSGLRSR